MTALFRATQRAADTLRQDVSYSIRALARSPGLTVTIIVTLGLGVGANAAVFTALDRVFFQAPPGVRDPASIRRLYAHQVGKNTPELGPGGKVTPFLTTRDMLDLGSAVRGMARVEGDYLYRRGRTVPDRQRVLVTFVSPGYFDVLGVRMERGRTFAPEESRLPGQAVPVAIISDGFWRSRFGTDPSVIGKTVRIDETTYTIIGVAAREFEGLELESVDLWAPLPNVEGGDITSLRVITRLEPGADVRLVAHRLSAQYRDTHFGDPRVDTASEIISASILAARGPTLSGVSVLRIPGMSERSIAVLARLGIIGVVVLVIAVANVASLLLMRALRRRREIAVRLALGVSNARLIGQLVTESVMLAVIAGAAAVVAAGLTGKLLRVQLAGGIRWTSTVVDQRVVILGMTLAVAGGCLAGLAPALFALRTDVGAALKAGAAAGSRVGSTLRSALLVTQAALCMALLASAGVLLQSLRRAEQADRGFDPDRTVLVSVPANYAGAEPELGQVAATIRAMPGVEGVGRSLTGLVGIGFRTKVGLSVSDTIGEGPQGPWVDFVDADWGRAAGVRLIGGTMLDSVSAFAQVAVINESLARALFRGRKIAGACIRVREPQGACREVIGVIRDIQWDPSTPTTYRVYLPLAQAWTRPNAVLVPNYLVVRTRSAASASDVARLRAVVAALTTRSGDATVQRVDDLLEPQLRPWRLAVALFLILGALGLAAAAAGIYGLVAYDVNQRTRELGVRIALGAPRARILRVVISSALRVVMVGVGAGTLAALITGRVMASLLYATAPYDPVVLVGTAAMLSLVAMIAGLLPAWRATRVSPIVALSAD
jgi:predicted permease